MSLCKRVPLCFEELTPDRWPSREESVIAQRASVAVEHVEGPSALQDSVVLLRRVRRANRHL